MEKLDKAPKLAGELKIERPYSCQEFFSALHPEAYLNQRSYTINH